MTEITRSNYQELLPEINEQIKNATFISFDAEFSGLGPPSGGIRTSLFDSGAERYQKLRSIVMQNTAPQIGFCIFRKTDDDAANVYHVDGYQAYVSEPCFASFNNTNNVVLSLEYKCAKFLRQCNFEFNALIERAVPYLNSKKTRDLTVYFNQHPDFIWKHPNRYFDKTFFPESERAGKHCYTSEDKVNIVKRLRGLSQIVDVIREHKIPLVGHNFALDLLYFFRMFCTELPDDYDTFKSLVGNFLPHVYDTKFMVLSCRKLLHSHPAYKNNQDKDKLESSSLFTAFLNTTVIGDRFCPHVEMNSTCVHFEKSLQIGRESDLEVDKNDLVHSPGFDSCITGILFLNISHIAARIDKNFERRTGPPTLSELLENVQSWKDQVFISRAAVLAMYLSGNDPKPCRPRWTEATIMQKINFPVLKESLLKLGPVDIEKINDYSFRFAAAGGKCARQMKKLLTDEGYKIKNINIPYNKESYAVSGELKQDGVYDRSKLLG
ncbi:pre-piRNA 3'-exonuclease trimmer isoform X2 [Folsomia candida]|uniref:Poly(A)-specific ribonuclease PARN n=1 Tax=Folsomia candida TaxID=158441 RepID=A0A226F3P2_FOLCA|nr:pre-piRNA 3'-exonuclease trimmer isoform X2 [Folsomia candida]OXA64412.1 Poly(A)-specific ribonuclease PARN [Folsomia candida]